MIRLLILGLLLTPAVAPQAGTGTIEGFVTANSIPVPNVVVTVQVGVNKGLQSNTDTSGHFSFRNIPDGNYRVSADAREGYAAPYKGGDFKSVLVTNGSPGRADLTLVRSGSLKGRVHHRDGTPVSGVYVIAGPTTYARNQVWLGASTSLGTYTAQTNAQGLYEIPYLNPAEYYVQVIEGPRSEHRGTYYPDAIHPSNAKPIVVYPDSQNVADIEWQVTSQFTVAGTVVEELASGGTHELSALYLINRDTRVRDDVPPNAISSPSRISTIPPQPDTNMPTRFLSDRQFEIRSVRPGSYDLFAIITTTSGTGGAQHSTGYMGRAEVAVVDTNIQNVRVVVRPGVTVSGNEVFALMPIGTTPALPAFVYSLMVANYEGIAKASLTNVPPGTYVVTSVGVSDFADVLQRGRSVSDSGLRLDSSEPAPIEIILAKATGTVTGVVQSSDPLATRYAWVTLALPLGQRENPYRYKTVRADGEGRFSFSNVVPGEYKMFVFDEIPYFASANSVFISRYESSGVAVTIQGGDTLRVNPSVIPTR